MMWTATLSQALAAAPCGATLRALDLRGLAQAPGESKDHIINHSFESRHVEDWHRHRTPYKAPEAYRNM